VFGKTEFKETAFGKNSNAVFCYKDFSQKIYLENSLKNSQGFYLKQIDKFLEQQLSMKFVFLTEAIA